MVQLADEDIQTREVLEWKGVHLFHFYGSSCSQKTRIVLNFKDAEWHSHELNLPANENFDPYYLGINPRGLVPTLVIDGEVHIESNDIITLIDKRLPGTKLVPDDMESKVSEILHHEDELHLDLRTITFRYTQPRGRAPKSPEALANYRAGGSGTVAGKIDANKQREIDFWENVAEHGITNEMIHASANRFRQTFDTLDETLANQPYLLGDNLSVLDIAWFIYVNRLMRCSYPFEKLHPNIYKWFEPLRERPEFAPELKVAPEIQKAVEENQRKQAEAGESLSEVAGF